MAPRKSPALRRKLTFQADFELPPPERLRNLLLINPPVLAANIHQVHQYPEAYPYGLLKLGTLLRERGTSVRLLDMMSYKHYGQGFADAWPTNVPLYGQKRQGRPGAGGPTVPVYLLGTPLEALAAELAAMEAPDEIWVTCGLTYNWEPARDVIRLCKEAFPGVTVRLGGTYPTLCPEHAAGAGADRIVRGKVAAAEDQLPDVTLLPEVPEVALFAVGTGCPNRCTFCVNHEFDCRLLHQPDEVYRAIKRQREELGIRAFSNWDVNVLLYAEELGELLDLVIADRELDISLAFNMGLQSNRLTPEIARKMFLAGTEQITIPFETYDPQMLRQFRKPHRNIAPIQAMDTLRDAGFDLSGILNCAIFGFPEEDPRGIVRTYLEMLRLGTQVIFSPWSPVPGSVDFERLGPVVEGREPDELNGFLFPALADAETIELYNELMELFHGCDSPEAAAEAARGLAPRHRRVFEEELALLRPASVTMPWKADAAGPGADGLRFRVAFSADLHPVRSDPRPAGDAAAPGEIRWQEDQLVSDLGEVASLLGHLRSFEGLPEQPLLRQEEAMLAYLERMQPSHANTFEPSLTWSGRGWSSYRHSFSFGDGRPQQRDSEVAEILSWCELLDDRIVPHAERLLGGADSEAVEQLLFGLDASPKRPWRYKIYLRLTPGRRRADREEKLRWMRRLIRPAHAPRIRERPEDLHLVGFDFTTHGVVAVKLYFLRDQEPDDLIFDGIVAGDWVRSRKTGDSRWTDVVTIYRIATGERAAPLALSEVDFHAGKNGIGFADVLAAARAGRLSFDPGLPAWIAERFPVALSRISLPTRGDKTNLYYLCVSPQR